MTLTDDTSYESVKNVATIEGIFKDSYIEEENGSKYSLQDYSLSDISRNWYDDPGMDNLTLAVYR